MKAIICQDTQELCNNYQEYLQTKHWKKFKYEYKQNHKNQCVFCLRKTDKLDIHHLSYENLGCETEEDVCELCYHYHRMLHKALDNNDIRRSLKVLKKYYD